MTHKSQSSLIRLDACDNDNWDINSAPVAVLNVESATHDRIAYCWGLANQLQTLSYCLNESSEPGVQRVSGLFLCHVLPLVTMLEKLGSDTAPRGGIQ